MRVMTTTMKIYRMMGRNELTFRTDGNISLNIDPDDQEHWQEEGAENGYDLILRQYLALNNPFMNWINNPWSDAK